MGMLSLWQAVRIETFRRCELYRHSPRTFHLHRFQRHIGNSCWRACDECVADGKTYCDSVTTNGPCRTCEGKDLPCMKHTSAVPGTKSVKLLEAEAQRLQFTAGHEDASTSDHNAAKRKTITSPMIKPELAHKNKRSASGQQVIDHGENRIVDPLGGQAHVPPQIKEAAVSEWLSEQASKCRSMYWILFDVATVLSGN